MQTIRKAHTASLDDTIINIATYPVSSAQGKEHQEKIRILEESFVAKYGPEVYRARAKVYQGAFIASVALTAAFYFFHDKL